ncbi:MAG: alpha/beta hydrolase [Actinobacteria bacterium]|nr:MAG: alpha/beta hydrolase [Actinomycetota bacterium]
MNELSFEVSGEGEPVVLLPGFPFGEHTFRQLAPLLATRFRVLTADLSGVQGDGSRAQAAAIRGRLRELGIERPALVAHGTGGRVAQVLAFGGGISRRTTRRCGGRCLPRAVASRPGRVRAGSRRPRVR